MSCRPLSRLSILAACVAAIVICGLPVHAEHVHHLYYNNVQWIDQDLTTLTGGGKPASFGAVTALYTMPNHQFHVYYTDGNSQHVHQLYYNNTSWSDQDLTLITGGPAASLYAISGFAIGNLQHVFYVGLDNHVHELNYNNSNWSDQDITATAGSTLANLAPILAFATTPNGQFHVYYQDLNNLDLHQLYFNGTSWSDSDLTAITGALCYTSWLSGFAVGNLQNVFCPGFGIFSNNLHMLHIYYNNSTWVYEDLTYKAGGFETPINLGSGVAAFRVPNSSQLEVYGVTDDTHIHQFTGKNGKWKDIDLTTSVGAPTDNAFGGIVAFPTMPNDQFHAYYQPSSEVYQLYFNGSSWSYQDLTNGSGQASDNSGMAGFATGNLQHVFYLGLGN